jgi:flagellar hook-associated protein 2
MLGPIGPSIGPNPKLVDGIMAPETVKVDRMLERRERIVEEKNEYADLSGLLGTLGGAVDGIKHRNTFTSMKVESSHPELLEGTALAGALSGSYEFEIEGLASQDRHLDVGFADRDKSTVGFGFMGIEVGEGKLQEVVVPPGSTLDDVTEIINDENIGVTAMVINTGFPQDPFRLLVSSDKTGEETNIKFDTDTTFLQMDNIRRASSMKVKFEGVDVKGEDNKLNELLPGVQLLAKRSEAGTKVQVNISEDVDTTMEGITGFVTAYNGLVSFSNQASDPKNSKAQTARSRSEVRTVMRQLQGQMSQPQVGKIANMASVGITTNAKTGELQVDQGKLKQALETDYNAVADLFVEGENGKGIASRMADAIQSLKDPVHGVVKSRLSGMDRRIREQDKQIETAERRVTSRREAVVAQVGRMNLRMNQMNGQQQFLTQRFGAQQGNTIGTAQ